MEVDKPRQSGADDLVRGLPMVSKWDPEALEREEQELAELAGKPWLQRMKGYLAKVGPGWLQSALTLGGGSAGTSLFAGAFLGYGLLWLQPLSMLLGIVMLSAIAYQTLSTNVRPFDALRKHVHPSVAWAWALASFIATIIWSFPQYGLAGGMAQDIVKAVTAGKVDVAPWVFGPIILVFCTWVTWNYGSGARGIRIYEKLIKGMVWLIVIAFSVVVVRQTISGNVEWGKVAKGLVPFNIPSTEEPLGALDEGFGLQVLQAEANFTKDMVDNKYVTEKQVDKWLKQVDERLRSTGRAETVLKSERYNRHAERMTALAKLMVEKKHITQRQADEALAPVKTTVARLNECRAIVEKGIETGKAETLAAVMASKGYVKTEQRKKIITELNGKMATVVMGGFGAAVGINMTFLLGYTLLARGWGKAHRSLARFDLLSGMLIPYSLATSLMIIACASTVYPSATRLNAVETARVLEPVVGLFTGRVVFGLGILGMALSTITLLMLVNAFILCEMVGWEPTGWRYKIASMTPAVGVLGSLLWAHMHMWIAVPTSAVCGLFLPIAYIGFFLLNNSKSYLGDAKPAGVVAWVWNILMLLAIAASLSSGVFFIYNNSGKITGLVGF